ncbi:TPA: helix-turn-helix domain-containing protein, partial [Listeria monocytogenes]|nr:helix-turn-helix domain-containing protein [Listeria monocytogenes]
MREYLDSKSQKKVALLEKIFYAENHTSTQEELLNDLNITYPTLISTIKTINFDIERFGYKAFSIVHSAPNLSYTLKISDNCSIQLIINAYIRESPKFQILETLLLSSFPNLQALAKKVHVSYSGIKKEIKELNEELRERNLYISTGNQVEITGDEFSLRIFYAFLFLVAYSGDRWPFSFVRYDEITDLLESCPKEIYRANSIDKAMMIHYYVAMHLLRDRMNCQIDTTRQFKVALYKACTEESKKSESAFIKKVAKQVPNRSYKEMTYTTQIILSTIVAFGSYSSIEKMPSFFYMDEQLEEMGFMKLVDFASEQVNDNLSIPFSEKEMELLRYSFASINYRYFLLDNLINKFNNIVPGYTDLDRNIRKIHKVNHLEPLISQLVNLKEMDPLKPFEERLTSDYLIILDKRIDFSIHTLPIKVTILSTISNETAVFDFMRYFSSYYNLEIINQVDPVVDLYISDFSVSPEVLTSLRINQPIIYVNTRWLESDYVKINDNLA